MKVYFILDDYELMEFDNEVRKVFPWICRKNTIYEADLISRWLITTDTPEAIEIIKKIQNEKVRNTKRDRTAL